MKLIKQKVCTDCLSIGIKFVDCICTYGKYETIELEFEQCECCGEIKDSPASSEFNDEQFKKLNQAKV